MATEAIEQALQEPNAAPAQPELLVSAVLHLMSHYTTHHEESSTCIRLASVIERHLKALADLPGLAPVLRATCQQLSEQWALVVEKAMPQPERFGLLSRLVGGTRVN
ncbi:MAG TPA: hypothetical protein VL528_02925 [Oxalicibacterium sp.]|jgi:hypothetical protein|nr:hypothetical protein [Oxalicibacterium sp.]